MVNPRLKVAKEEEYDEREHSITFKLAPLSVQIFQYTPVQEKPVDNKTAKSRKNVKKEVSKTKTGKRVEEIKKAVMEEGLE